MKARPNIHRGLKHIALKCIKLEECVHFYEQLIGMQIVWQPDNDNVYLSSGDDNLALHRSHFGFADKKHQPLDHIGFFLKEAQEVDDWHQFLLNENVEIVAAPKNHRDGTRSFYCEDPDGNVIQFIYYPNTTVAKS